MDKYFIINTNGTMAESNTHVIYTTLFGYILTTKENYNSRVSDARKEQMFYDKDGFRDISDVVEYIEKWF